MTVATAPPTRRPPRIGPILAVLACLALAVPLLIIGVAVRTAVEDDRREKEGEERQQQESDEDELRAEQGQARARQRPEELFTRPLDCTGGPCAGIGWVALAPGRGAAEQGGAEDRLAVVAEQPAAGPARLVALGVDGTERWRADLPEGTLDGPLVAREAEVAATVTTADGPVTTVVAGETGVVRGQERGRLLPDPGGIAPAVVVAPDGVVAIPDDDDDGGDGVVRLDGPAVDAAAEIGAIAVLGPDELVLHHDDGEVRWRAPARGARAVAMASSTVTDLVVTAGAGRVEARSEGDGAVVWAVDGLAVAGPEDLTSVGPTVVVGDGDEVVGLSASDGSEQWRVPRDGWDDLEAGALVRGASAPSDALWALRSGLVTRVDDFDGPLGGVPLRPGASAGVTDQLVVVVDAEATTAYWRAEAAWSFPVGGTAVGVGGGPRAFVEPPTFDRGLVLVIDTDGVTVFG